MNLKEKKIMKKLKTWKLMIFSTLSDKKDKKLKEEEDINIEIKDK